MPKLSIFPNDINANIDDQLHQIKLSLLSVNTWGQRIKNQLTVDFNDVSAQDVSIVNNEYQTFGYNFPLNPPSSLINVSGNILIKTGAESTLGFFLDNVLVYEAVFNYPSDRNTISFNFMANTTSGVNHNLVAKFKGNVTKFVGKNKVQVLSLVN